MLSFLQLQTYAHGYDANANAYCDVESGNDHVADVEGAYCIAGEGAVDAESCAEPRRRQYL